MQKLHFDYQEGRKIFFTSDLHIGHRNILRFCQRPFLDLKDMATDIAANWNSVVGENDIIFDLGDMFWWNSRHEVKKFVDKLNGTIYKVPGNHDMDCRRLFELCDPEKVTVLDDISVVWIENLFPETNRVTELWLSHMPLMTWPHRGNGAINLFGHIHSGPLSTASMDVPEKDLHLWPKQQYDVGADNNNYTPIEIQEIFKKLDRNVNWKPQMYF